MDKHKQDDGFTLIEMILVLFITSFLLLMFPMVRMKNEGLLNMQVTALRYDFMKAQSDALHKKLTIPIVCDATTCSIDDKTIVLANNMHCNGSVRFNENGNASRATTFTCSIASSQREIIVQLGSGRMYVK